MYEFADPVSVLFHVYVVVYLHYCIIFHCGIYYNLPKNAAYRNLEGFQFGTITCYEHAHTCLPVNKCLGNGTVTVRYLSWGRIVLTSIVCLFLSCFQTVRERLFRKLGRKK